MSKTRNEIWFAVEDIPQNHPFMMSGALKFMIQEWPKRGLGGHVKKYFTWFEEDLGKMCYVRKEFDAQADFLSKKMLNGPQWALKVIADVEKWSALFFKEAAKFRQLPFSKMSNKQLLRAWRKPLRWHLLSHGYGASVSWNADAEKERVTKGILSMIERQIRKHKLKINSSIAFSTLSTPEKTSPIRKEEVHLLKLVINRGGLKALGSHAKKYEWLNYQYKGPAYGFDYFQDRFKALKPDQARRVLKDIKDGDNETKKQKQGLIKKLKFDKSEVDLVKMAQEMVFIKDFRKESLYHGHYCYEPFFREIGRRFGLSIDQIHAMHYWEIIELLKTGRFDIDELNERLKFAVTYVTPNRFDTYTGKKARQFLSKIKWEVQKNSKAKIFQGTCAYPGKIRGRVKIINLPKDMVKMKKGDILVAHNTNPNVVPAMRLASAMISGAGGLTCHTAIIARELHKPSIVGIANIDKFLKDGDLVEVDATRGVIRKL